MAAVKYALDTSVLVRILSNQPQPLAGEVISRIDGLLKGGAELIVSNLVLSETYYAMQQHYGVDKRRVLAALGRISREPGFLFSPEACAALAEPDPESLNPGFVDRLIHGEQQSRGVAVLSCEKSFRRLPDAIVLP